MKRCAKMEILDCSSGNRVSKIEYSESLEHGNMWPSSDVRGIDIRGCKLKLHTLLMHRPNKMDCQHISGYALPMQDLGSTASSHRQATSMVSSVCTPGSFYAPSIDSPEQWYEELRERGDL